MNLKEIKKNVMPIIGRQMWKESYVCTNCGVESFHKMDALCSSCWSIKIKREEKKRKLWNSVGLVILILAIEIFWHIVFEMSLILLGAGMVFMTALTVYITSKLLGFDKIDKEVEQQREQNEKTFLNKIKTKQTNERTKSDPSLTSPEIYISNSYSIHHYGQELKGTICIGFDDSELITLKNLRSGAKDGSFQEFEFQIKNGKQEELFINIYQQDEEPWIVRAESIAKTMEQEKREQFLLNMRKDRNPSNKIVFLGTLKIPGIKKIERGILEIIIKICYKYSCLKPTAFYKTEKESILTTFFIPSEEYLLEARRVYDIYQKLYSWGDKFERP